MKSSVIERQYIIDNNRKCQLYSSGQNIKNPPCVDGRVLGKGALGEEEKSGRLEAVEDGGDGLLKVWRE